jgi:hypothetical protein
MEQVISIIDFLGLVTGILSVLILPMTTAIALIMTGFKKYMLIREEREEEWRKPPSNLPEISNSPPWLLQEQADVNLKHREIEDIEETTVTEERKPLTLPEFPLKSNSSGENKQDTAETEKANVVEQQTSSPSSDLESYITKELLKRGKLRVKLSLSEETPLNVLGKKWKPEEAVIELNPEETSSAQNVEDNKRRFSPEELERFRNQLEKEREKRILEEEKTSEIEN